MFCAVAVTVIGPGGSVDDGHRAAAAAGSLGWEIGFASLFAGAGCCSGNESRAIHADGDLQRVAVPIHCAEPVRLGGPASCSSTACIAPRVSSISRILGG